MRNLPGASLVRVAEFAVIVKNLVRPLGYCRLGLPSHSWGPGNVFPWPVKSQARFDGHIVEDMKLGADLGRMGAPPLFSPEAEVMYSFRTHCRGLIHSELAGSTGT